MIYKSIAELQQDRKDVLNKIEELKATFPTDEEVEKGVEIDEEKAADMLSLQKQLRKINSDIRIEELASQKAKKALEGFKIKPQESNEKYLNTDQAILDYADILEANIGKSLKDVHKSWKEHLLTKGITNPEVLYPTAVVQEIMDALDPSGSIYATFRKIPGVYVWSNALNTSLEAGLGFVDGQTKKEQTITLARRDISCQFIYKYIQIDKSLLKITSDTRSILRYILQELPARVLRTVEKTAIIGSPELTGNDAITSIIPIATDVAPYIVPDVASTGNAYVDLLNLIGQITAPGPLYVVTSRAFATGMRTALTADGSLVFPVGMDYASALGVSNIFTPDWFPADGDVLAVIYAGRAYEMIGDNVIENHENFIMQRNKEEFLSEIFIGGALMLPNSAGKIVAPALP